MCNWHDATIFLAVGVLSLPLLVIVYALVVDVRRFR